MHIFNYTEHLRI